MSSNSYGYQYETSPRKLQPEYDRKPKKKKKVTNNKKTKQVTTKQNNVEVKPKSGMHTKEKAKLIIYILLGFVVLLAIGYQNSLITESFNAKEQLKKDLSSIQKENEQLKVNIENGLNLNNIEQSAKELLGMQKLDNSQKIYVNLPKKDYVESPKEDVKEDEDYSVWDKISNGIKELLNK